MVFLRKPFIGRLSGGPLLPDSPIKKNVVLRGEFTVGHVFDFRELYFSEMLFFHALEKGNTRISVSKNDNE